MTILPKKTSQRPPGGGGGATAEGSQEHQHPQGGHFNISSQVQESYEVQYEHKIVWKTSPAIAPHPMCRDFLKRVVVFGCPAQNVTPRIRGPWLLGRLLILFFQAAEAHERLFVSAGGKD